MTREFDPFTDKEVPNEPAKSDNIGEQIHNNKSWLASFASALAQGVAQGGRDLGSNIDKAGAKIYKKTGIDPSALVHPGETAINYLSGNHPTPEQIQQQYIANTNEYNQNPDTNAHPYAAGLGRMIAHQAPLIPLYAMGMGGMGGTGASFVKAGAPKLLGSGINIADMALTNAASAGLTNTPEQGTDVFNAPNAINAAKWSVPLGVGSQLIGAAAGKAGSLFSPAQSVVTDANIIAQDNLAAKVGSTALSQATKPSMNPVIKHLLEMGATAAAGSVGGYYYGGKEGAMLGGLLGSGIAASPSVIGALAKSTPLVSLFKGIDKLGQAAGSNPGVTSYYAGQLMKGLTNAGINLYSTHTTGEKALKTDDEFDPFTESPSYGQQVPKPGAKVPTEILGVRN